MNVHDRELLDKQFQWLHPSTNHNNAMILAIVGVFLAGISLGGFLASNKDSRAHHALNGKPTLVSVRGQARAI